jgi:hypothetical protein
MLRYDETYLVTVDCSFLVSSALGSPFRLSALGSRLSPMDFAIGLAFSFF